MGSCRASLWPSSRTLCTGIWTVVVAGLLLVAGALSLATSGMAVGPDEVLKDAALEKRARDISTGLRCVVCQNQSIDESDAPLAKDLRFHVRDRLKKGDSDEEVVAWIVERYGEFVLLRPPFALHTIALWLAPLLVLVGALYLGWMQVMRQPATAAAGPRKPLSEAERAKLEQLMDEGGAAGGADRERVRHDRDP
ncbi:MAG: cytochrome c-type biogenesis protein [Pseudomonadota bacterium]